MNPRFVALCLLSPRLLRPARDGFAFSDGTRIGFHTSTQQAGDHVANAAGVVFYGLLAYRLGRFTFSRHYAARLSSTPQVPK
jgi:hypothetical protein